MGVGENQSEEAEGETVAPYTLLHAATVAPRGCGTRPYGRTPTRTGPARPH